MGVYIKDMEMPTVGTGKVIMIDSDGDVWAAGKDECTIIAGAKAVPVSPHGRLIDADALIDWIYSDEPNAWKAPFRLCTADRSDVKFLLKQAPAIIEAEKGE